MDGWQTVTLRVTAVLLIASGVLIGFSVAGIGSSIFLGSSFALLGVLLVLARSELASLPTILDFDVGEYAQDLWLVCFLVGFALVWYSSASPMELQTLGGVAGFAGMVNYFLRPLYGMVVSMVTPADQTAG